MWYLSKDTALCEATGMKTQCFTTIISRISQTETTHGLSHGTKEEVPVKGGCLGGLAFYSDLFFSDKSAFELLGLLGCGGTREWNQFLKITYERQPHGFVGPLDACRKVQWSQSRSILLPFSEEATLLRGRVPSSTALFHKYAYIIVYSLPTQIRDYFILKYIKFHGNSILCVSWSILFIGDTFLIWYPWWNVSSILTTLLWRTL